MCVCERIGRSKKNSCTNQRRLMCAEKLASQRELMLVCVFEKIGNSERINVCV